MMTQRDNVKSLCEDTHIVEKVSNTQDEFTEAGHTSALPHT